jgi:ribosomal protein S18 acetylase RimI-like enzyme
MRLIKLPDDLEPLGDLIAESFQYPENESWSVQTDEKEQLLEAVHNLSRLWSLISIIQFFSSSLRDIFRGYVWEDNEKIVGLTLLQRRGTTKSWVVSTVGVLPEFRRHGIARKLVERGLDLIREHGGNKAILGVIDGNLPAIKLYESLGFEHFGKGIIYEGHPENVPPEPDIPEGYSISSMGRFDWEPRYDLEKRITPQRMLKYEPVEIGRFRQPFMTRFLVPIVNYAQGTKNTYYIIRTRDEGKIAAWGAYYVPTRGKGINELNMRVDPEYPQIASYLLSYLLNQVMTLSPGYRVEFHIQDWLEPLVNAAEEAGFKQRMVMNRMGIIL